MIIKNFLYKVLLACFFTMSSVSQINTYQGHYIKLGHSMKSIVRMGSAAAVRVAQKAMQNKLAQRAWDVKYSLVGAALFSIIAPVVLIVPVTAMPVEDMVNRSPLCVLKEIL